MTILSENVAYDCYRTASILVLGKVSD